MDNVKIFSLKRQLEDWETNGYNEGPTTKEQRAHVIKNFETLIKDIRLEDYANKGLIIINAPSGCDQVALVKIRSIAGMLTQSFNYEPRNPTDKTEKDEYQIWCAETWIKFMRREIKAFEKMIVQLQKAAEKFGSSKEV